MGFPAPWSGDTLMASASTYFCLSTHGPQKTSPQIFGSRWVQGQRCRALIVIRRMAASFRCFVKQQVIRAPALPASLRGPYTIDMHGNWIQWFVPSKFILPQPKVQQIVAPNDIPVWMHLPIPVHFHPLYSSYCHRGIIGETGKKCCIIAVNGSMRLWTRTGQKTA
jgi:hypothetical protein